MGLSALFSGSAAAATNDSMLKWSQLFAQQAAQKEQADLQREQFLIQQKQFNATLDAEDRRLLSQQNFQMALEENRQLFEQGMLDQKSLLSFASEATSLAMKGQLTNEQMLNLGQMMQGNDALSPYGRALAAAYRTQVYQNPAEAAAFLNFALSDPLGANLSGDKFSYDMAVDALLQLVSPEEREDLKKYYNDAFAALTSQKEFVRDTAKESMVANVAQVQANTALAEAQTESVQVGTERQKADLEILTDLAPLNKQQLESIIANTNLTNQELMARLEMLPRLLAVEVNTKELSLKQLEDTYDAVVSLAAEELRSRQLSGDMTELEIEMFQSDLRVQLATEGAREAIIAKQPELISAQIKQVHQGIEESRQNILASQASIEDQAARLEILRDDAYLRTAGFLADLITTGQLEMVDSLGPSMLRQLGIENPGSVTDRITARITSDMEKAEALAVIQSELLTAQSDLARWQADTAQEKFEFDKWLSGENLEINKAQLERQREQLQLQRQHQQWQHSQPRTGGGGSGGGVSAANGPFRKDGTVDTEELIRRATGGLNGNQFASAVQGYRENLLGTHSLSSFAEDDFYMALAQDINFYPLVDYFTAYAVEAMQYGVNPMPPGWSTNDPIFAAVVEASGLFSPAQNTDPTRMVDPNNLKQVADLTNGDAGLVMSVWERLDPESRDMYGTPDNYVAAAQATSAERDEAARREASQMQALNSLINSGAVPMWNSPVANLQDVNNMRAVLAPQLANIREDISHATMAVVRIGQMNMNDPGRPEMVAIVDQALARYGLQSYQVDSWDARIQRLQNVEQNIARALSAINELNVISTNWGNLNGR